MLRPLMLVVLLALTPGWAHSQKLKTAAPEKPVLLFPIKQAGKWGYIDNAGKLAVATQFDSAGAFSEGLAAVRLGDKYGFIDPAGKYVIDPLLLYADAFSEGLAAVGVVGKDGSGSYCYINKAGKIVVSFKKVKPEDIGGVYRFSQGLARVNIQDKFRFIDKTGKFIGLQKYDWAGDYSDGLAPVKIKQAGYVVEKLSCGYINKTGKMVIKPQFDDGGPFVDGLARVKTGGKYGYINKIGKMVINPAFDDAQDFS